MKNPHIWQRVKRRPRAPLLCPPRLSVDLTLALFQTWKSITATHFLLSLKSSHPSALQRPGWGHTLLYCLAHLVGILIFKNFHAVSGRTGGPRKGASCDCTSSESRELEDWACSAGLKGPLGPQWPDTLVLSCSVCFQLRLSPPVFRAQESSSEKPTYTRFF